MPLKSPQFWEQKNTFLSKMLYPFSRAYARVSRWTMERAKPFKASIPVVCIGNLVMGGVGKTPLAISIAQYFKLNGVRPAFLTRGYGGGMTNIVVDTEKHTARETGDESMLLAQIAPTVVDVDRRRGAKTAMELGAEVIIMDDGFQNPHLYKDLSFVVFDGKYGYGNGRVFPAGPLREPMEAGLMRADAFVVVGQDDSGIKDWIDSRFPSIPYVGVHIEQSLPSIQQLAGRKAFAFAGIGFPNKFFDMLKLYGCQVVGSEGFGDHHPYTAADMRALIEKADRLNASLVTTAKDKARIPHEFLPHVYVIDAYSVWDTPDTMSALLSPLIKKR